LVLQNTLGGGCFRRGSGETAASPCSFLRWQMPCYRSDITKEQINGSPFRSTSFLALPPAIIGSRLAKISLLLPRGSTSKIKNANCGSDQRNRLHAKKTPKGCSNLPRKWTGCSPIRGRGKKARWIDNLVECGSRSESVRSF
jgi:hypothetical protein